jgi:Fic-DOC domain mobile mystery protein B
MGSPVKESLPPGATPLTPEEQEGLIPSIQTRGELNEFEASNIDAATLWAFGRGRRSAQRDVISVTGLLALHRRMFDQTWKWAGQIRWTDKNIGVPKGQIRDQLQALCGDVQYQIEHDTYPPDELAIRFHHRLVSIHPFPNGNGRFGRSAADILVVRLGGKPFSWGGYTLDAPSSSRSAYIKALREADGGEISGLVTFARTNVAPRGRRAKVKPKSGQ